MENLLDKGSKGLGHDETQWNRDGTPIEPGADLFIGMAPKNITLPLPLYISPKVN